MHEVTYRVVIVGGGAAGWITAGLVAAGNRRVAGRELEVVLVESPDIPTIGVGEGTWPSMRATLRKIGIGEAELIRECDATFKQGTHFIGWAGEGEQHHYYHPFSLPAEYSSLNLADYWLAHGRRTPFAEFVTPQARVIAAGLAPKQQSTPDYAFNVNYAYHLDAGKFAQLLRRHAVGHLGVRHVAGTVEGVDLHPHGDIAAVRLAAGERLQGDLFVDCTGPRALLIGRHLGIDLVPVQGYLFNDAAIAVQVPRTKANEPIASATLATAVPTGWIWDIGLQARRGVGHVYSSAHTDEARATEVARQYVSRTSPEVRLEELSFRSIRFEPGYRRAFWVNNCVAVGLSGGFIEPLEASALALVEQCASFIARQLPADRAIMSAAARRFNDKMRYHWERIIEFLKLHYVLSARRDSAYWRDARAEASWPDGLGDRLALWQQQPPWHDDAPRVDELFPSASYQYVLYGMGFEPRYHRTCDADRDDERERADRVLHANEQKARQLLNLLPAHRDLINSMTSLRGVA